MAGLQVPDSATLAVSQARWVLLQQKRLVAHDYTFHNLFTIMDSNGTLANYSGFSLDHIPKI